jgi:hypothetical protein
MKIETKFDIGDEVYFLHGSSIIKSNVEYITISIDENDITILYSFKGYNRECESRCFKSIKELTKHWEDKLK